MVNNVLKEAELFLKKSGAYLPEFCAKELLFAALGTRHPKKITPDQYRKFQEFVRRKALFEPLDYIIGKLFFYNVEIEVTPAVLIPRAETEMLVDIGIKELEKENLTDKVLWDICTGSGCIGIALKKRFKELRVILSDISEEALVVAKRNASLNEVDVEFRCGDFLNPFRGERADFIFSNPPYVTEEEYVNLSGEVHKEPKLALVGGLDFYKRFKQEISFKTKLFFEIGEKQGKAIKELFLPLKGRLSQDLAGRDRFFLLER